MRRGGYNSWLNLQRVSINNTHITQISTTPEIVFNVENVIRCPNMPTARAMPIDLQSARFHLTLNRGQPFSGFSGFQAFWSSTGDQYKSTGDQYKSDEKTL